MKTLHKRILIGTGIVTGALVTSELLLSHYLLQYAVSRNSSSGNRKVKKKTVKSAIFGKLSRKFPIRNFVMFQKITKESIPLIF